MLEKLENLLLNNKNRLKSYTIDKENASTEYSEAYYLGLIDGLDSAIFDLEEIIKEMKNV